MNNAVFVALLRGINVAGNKPIKMARLQTIFEELGFEHVTIYLQSGNDIFRASKRRPENLSKTIEEKIHAVFGFSVTVFILSSEELGNTLDENPFTLEKGIDLAKLHVTFLSETPQAPALKKLLSAPAEPDDIQYRKNRIYLYCPNGYGRTKLTNNMIEKTLSVSATTRNWKTVNELYRLATMP
jgi:uncharacterized protein (DUF1697 family)